METNTTPEPAVQLLPDLPPNVRLLILHAQRKLLSLRCERGLPLDLRSGGSVKAAAVPRHSRKFGEKPSYPIPVWNGLLEHRRRIAAVNRLRPAPGFRWQQHDSLPAGGRCQRMSSTERGENDEHREER